MSNAKAFIKGTVILTAAGFLSRFLGFFFRIYLSRNFSEENIGIYQLLAPLSALVFAICAAGLQTAISKYVAASASKGKDYALNILWGGALFGLFLSFLLFIPVYHCADDIAVSFLKEARTAPLIRLYALSIPFSVVHSCINGFFYGLQKTWQPAISQLIEQCTRIITLIFLCEMILKASLTPLIYVAGIGMITSETAAALYSMYYLYRYIIKNQIPISIPDMSHLLQTIQELFHMAWPLTASRVVITLLLAVEASYMPEMLVRAGLSRAAALGSYGILTGMALPLILFPNTIANSFSVLLLPMVSEAEEQGRNRTIVKATRRSIKYCCLWGGICCLAFYVLGPWITNYIFHNAEAGVYVRKLSFICPFLYLSVTTGSILHGLGRTKITFLSQIISLASRLAFVFRLIPVYGINAYFSGLLTSQILLCVFYLLALRRFMYYTV